MKISLTEKVLKYKLPSAKRLLLKKACAQKWKALEFNLNS
jgi:hypothetical protein